MPRPKKRVLFLCIGNSCRSPMAEGFARAYGSDVLEASSAGLAPAGVVQPMTKKVMRARNISLDEQFPMDLQIMDLKRFDLIVNLSGCELPFTPPCPVVEWAVRDPIGAKESVYEQVRDEIESRVIRLVLDLRRLAPQPKPS
ncbi:MAG: arsenate reductase ArsC [Bryobacterales bacterium]|nr:arsenate reductase ArsC [Bryobacterales bacterium]